MEKGKKDERDKKEGRGKGGQGKGQQGRGGVVGPCFITLFIHQFLFSYSLLFTFISFVFILLFFID